MRRMIGRWRVRGGRGMHLKARIAFKWLQKKLKGQRKLVTRMLLILQTENVYETCVGGRE